MERVGVVGCGLMGSGIAEVCARAGADVIVVERDADALKAGRERVERSLSRAVTSGKLNGTAQTFNIGGTTYEINEISQDGSSFKLVKSSKTVPEIPPPLSLTRAIQQLIGDFAAKSLTIRPVRTIAPPIFGTKGLDR